MRRLATVSFVCLGACLILCLAQPARAAGPCEECHYKDDISEGNRTVHPPFKEDDCTSCHLDHGGENRLMLMREGNQLCRMCHQFEKETFIASHQYIRGDRAACLSCHDPHRSALDNLLISGLHRPLAFGRCDPCHRFDGGLHKSSVKELCLSCHNGDEFSRSYGHAPAIDGKCLLCHDPHGSRTRALLVEFYTDSRWVSRAEEYSLCLECHAPETFTTFGPQKTTNFRSGTLNIHQIHIEGGRNSGKVAPDRGLACHNCHEVHSSSYPKLIRASLDCGGVPCLRLEFRTLDEGGECTVSCHGTKVYYWDGVGPQAQPAEASPPTRPPPVAVSRAEPTSLEKSINRKCRSCHQERIQEFSRGKVHPPVAAGHCSACHLDHGNDNMLILLEREDRLCGRCHNIQSKGSRSAHRGYPLRGTNCTECHDPHASSNSSLLYEFSHNPFTERDCTACHDKPERGWTIGKNINKSCTRCHEGIMSSPYLHSALSRKSCTGCHQAHVSKGKTFLRAEYPDLCFLCHENEKFEGESVHSPVAGGDCGSCHPPHGSDQAGLLARPYPLKQYVEFTEEAYGLCWDCHAEETILTSSATARTGFKDDNGNLHALHVRNRRSVSELGERVLPGVSCRNCHNPHATPGPKLIIEELDCDGVPCLQLEFHKAGAGGRCQGGCHTLKSYIP